MTVEFELSELEALVACALMWKSCRVSCIENVTPKTVTHLADAEAALSAAVTAYVRAHPLDQDPLAGLR